MNLSGGRRKDGKDRMESRVEETRESRERETGKGFRVVSEASFLRDLCRNEASAERPVNRFANRSILLSLARPENRSSTFPGQNHFKFLARDETGGLSFIATVPTIERRNGRSFAICKHKRGTTRRHPRVCLSIMHEEREGEFLRSIRDLCLLDSPFFFDWNFSCQSRRIFILTFK